MVDFNAEDYTFDEDEDTSAESNDEKEDSAKKNEKLAKKKRPRPDDDPLQKNSKKSKNDLYKQPSAEELNKLKETENLFNSNIFRLQINELLGEIKIKPKFETQFDLWFTEFKTQIMQIPEFTDEIDLTHLALSQKKKRLSERQKFINYAVDNVDKVPCGQDVTMKFMKPTNIISFGSLKNIPNEKTKFNGNILLSMNKLTFFEKDYMNNKYALKKQFYTAYIQYFIKSFDNIKEVCLKNYLNNKHIRYIQIVPSFSENVCINIFIAPQTDTFKNNRFMPNRNNVKQLSLDEFPEFDVESFKELGTPLYNSVILFDCTLATNQMHLETTIGTHENIKDAIKLIVVWLRQRSLNIDYRGFTDDLVLYTLCHLLSKKKINKLMSSYQVVRIFWSFLAAPIEKVSIMVDVKPNDLALFAGEVVLLDPSGCFNVATFLDVNIYAKVKYEAKVALECLDSNRFSAFASLFTIRMTVGLQYDAILKITDLNRFKKIYWNCSDDDKFKYFGFYELMIQNYIEKLLKYGLGDRVCELVPIFSENANLITFGINLNAETYYNVIVKGPKQYDDDAKEFKEFWDKLADLRRFKDASIYEAVFFAEVKTVQDRRLIFAKIIDFVLREKLELNYILNGNEMEKLLKMEHIEYPFPTGSNEEAILKIKGSQTELDKILRNLKLPLPITAVQCTSDLYSYTDVFPPVPTDHNWKKLNCTERGDFITINDITEDRIQKLPHLVEPVECVLQLALNSKWPKTLSALRAMKTIYYYEIAKLLRTDHNILASVRDDFIDVFYRGYVFRLRLHHPKEIIMLKKDETTEGVVFYRDTEESLQLERELVILPKISGALNGLQQQYPSFGPSTCMIKRWLRSQMLDADHISDVVINLLNASLYIRSEPYRSAVLPQIAFIRFLKFLADFDHNFQLVVVNFNDALSVEQMNDIEGRFLQTRQNFNTLHILTPFDDGRSIFTHTGPSKHALFWMKCLAAETYKGLIGSLNSEEEIEYKSYFVPNLTGYNATIHLNASTNLRRYQQVNREQSLVLKLAAFDENKAHTLPVVGFDPIELFLSDLRKNYGQYAAFFHDFYGGPVIGVVWKQEAVQELDFKISSVHGRELTTSNKLKLNTDAIIEDFYSYGNGIIRSIDC